MKWSESAWNAAKPVYDKILSHPFILGLMDGSLDRLKFSFYIRQDAIYLSEYGKVLAGIASRLPEPRHTEAFLHFAGETVAVEKSLHEGFVKELKAGVKGEASPSCLLYTSYLLQQMAIAPVEVMAAAVLPCFWIYKEVGDYILANQTKGENPYQSWINTYGGEEFAGSVRSAIAICDELADKCTAGQRKAMADTYLMCSKMEWMFWDSAWNLENWKI